MGFDARTAVVVPRKIPGDVDGEVDRVAAPDRIDDVVEEGVAFAAWAARTARIALYPPIAAAPPRVAAVARESCTTGECSIDSCGLAVETMAPCCEDGV